MSLHNCRESLQNRCGIVAHRCGNVAPLRNDVKQTKRRRKRRRNAAQSLRNQEIDAQSMETLRNCCGNTAHRWQLMKRCGNVSRRREIDAGIDAESDARSPRFPFPLSASKYCAIAANLLRNLWAMRNRFANTANSFRNRFAIEAQLLR
jgi:hypothetical protein